jgi:hypothetical protein
MRPGRSELESAGRLEYALGRSESLNRKFPLKGELDLRTANTVAYCCGVHLKAVETAELGRRLEEVERATKIRSG